MKELICKLANVWVCVFSEMTDYRVQVFVDVHQFQIIIYKVSNRENQRMTRIETENVSKKHFRNSAALLKKENLITFFFKAYQNMQGFKT